MIRELRYLSFTVARCSAAIEMPDVIAARDDLIRRYVKSVHPPEPPARPAAPSRLVDVNELPVYWS